MRDAFLCSEQGLPSATVVTTPFVHLARLTATALAAPETPVMVIDHPIWTRDEVWMQDTAEKVADTLVPILFGSR